MLHLARAVLRTVNSIDEYYMTFEWGAGGITHGHILKWIQGSPRVERVVRPDNEGNIPAGAEDVSMVCLGLGWS